MKSVPGWLHWLASLVSTFGHPLLLGALFMVVVTFQELPAHQATLLSVLLVSGVIGPVAWQNYRRMQRGEYTNFDVSDRRQRYRFYPMLLVLLALLTAVFLITNQPKPFTYGLLSVFILIGTAYLVNFASKLSLHAAVSFYLVWPTLLLSRPAGLWMGAAALLIAGSRLILRRHTLSEVAQGALLGTLVGVGFYLIMGE